MDRFSHASARDDAQADRQRHSSTIHCMMVSMGDKYDVPALVFMAAARLLAAFGPNMSGDDVEDRFWSCHQMLAGAPFSRHRIIQDVFVHIAAMHFQRLNGDRLRRWCDDHHLGYRIAQSLSQNQNRFESDNMCDLREN